METSKSNTEKYQDLIGVCLLGFMVLVLFYPMFFMDKAIISRDYHFVTFPFRYFLSQAYHQGVIPYWIPNAYGGMPFMAVFHPGVFYPPSVVFFLQDTVLAMNLFYFLHLLVLGLFLYLLGKLWRFSFAARMATAVTGMLSGYIVAAILCSNYFLAAVWLPMIFWMFLKFREENHIGYFIGAVLAIATQTLAACPEISMMTVGLLYLHQLWMTPRTEGKSPYLRVTFWLGLAVFFALGLSALQLWPTAKLLAHSPRVGGMGYSIHTHWSLEFTKLTSLVLSPVYMGISKSGELPDFFGGFLITLYMGVVSLVCIFLGFFIRKEKPVAFWLVVFVLGIVFALGKNNPLYEYFFKAIPFLGLFRFPAKYYFMSSFAAVFLTGFVLDAILKQRERHRLRLFPVLSVFIIVVGMVGIVGLRQPYLGMETSLMLLFALGCAYILFHYEKIRKAVFAGMILSLIFIDLSLKDFRLLPLIDRKFYDDQPVLMKSLAGAYGKHRIYSGTLHQKPGDPKFPRAPTVLDSVVLLKQYMVPYTGMVYGIEHIGGRIGIGMGLNHQMEWYTALIESDLERRLIILKRSNVRYWIDQDSDTLFGPDGKPTVSPDRVKVLEGALPRAYLVPGMRILKEGAVLNTYYDESFDPLRKVLLSEPVEFQQSDHFEGQVEEVSYRPNHVTVKTSQEGSGFLVLNDSYFPGWTVKVDGEEKPILQANHFYRAVQLEPGEHTLEFDFYPEGFKVGLMISGVSFLLLIFGALFFREPVGKSLPVEKDIEANA